MTIIKSRQDFPESSEADRLDDSTISKNKAKNTCLYTQLVDPTVSIGLSEMTLIHASAVVHPDAVLGEGVEIGAHCTVGPQVKLGSGCKLHPGSHIFGQTHLGEKCVLLSGAVVGADIPGRTVIGDNNIIGHHAVVGVKCQDMKYKEGDECFLYIGNNNDIREFVSIHLSSKSDDHTILGNYNLIMGSCHIAHDCKIGSHNILANSTLLGGHVVLEDLVHTGGAVAVHQFCNIGSYSFLAGGSMVDRDVPMFMMVAGNRAELRGLNLEGMRRSGFSEQEVRRMRRAYQKLFMNCDSNAGSMEERLSGMEQSEEFSTVTAVKLMLQSVRDCFAENRRGICRFRHWTTVSKSNSNSNSQEICRFRHWTTVSKSKSRGRCGFRHWTTVSRLKSKSNSHGICGFRHWTTVSKSKSKGICGFRQWTTKSKSKSNSKLHCNPISHGSRGKNAKYKAKLIKNRFN